MARLVVKFGGTSVADPQRIELASLKVAAEVRLGHQVVVVVSAMSGVTNRLIGYCGQINPLADTKERDAVIASGEQITAGLMAIALQKLGLQSRSWMGWQVPLICDEHFGHARIIDLPPEHLESQLIAGIIPVVAGFQGVSENGRIATLGRGGSDTTAVALAAALKADRCDIYTDVDGVYTTDPRIVSSARKLPTISYEEMLEMAALGAKVLHPRSVELAMAWKVPVQVLSSFNEAIGSDYFGTLVTGEENILEKQIVNGVAFSRNEAKVVILSVPDMPGVAASIFSHLAEEGVNVDMIVQNVSPDGKTTDITFTVARSELFTAEEALKKTPLLKDAEIRTDGQVAKVSVIGIGMNSHVGVAKTMFQTLADKGINILAIGSSEIKISVLIKEDYVELAVRALHTAFDLESDSPSSS